MKAISPVIATVIIVAVAIAIAVAVAFWMTGITGTFTRYEKLEITYAYADWDETSGQWTITLKVKNTGPSDATIDDIFVNGKPFTALTTTPTVSYTKGGTPSTFTSGTGFTISSGGEATITIVIPNTKNPEFGHGQTVEIKLHTASGNEYPKQVTLQ